MSTSTSRSTSRLQAERSAAAAGYWPVLLCWVAVALDGFDLVVLGAVIPTLSKTGPSASRTRRSRWPRRSA